MFYKFEYNYERCQSCVVEADSLEEALKIANDEGDWEDIDWQECRGRCYYKGDNLDELEYVDDLTEDQLP